MRTQPNILVTGTPGVGKSTHCAQLAQTTGLKHVSINQFAKDRDCHDGYDAERQTWIVDEDKLLDALEQDAWDGGLLLDWHACDLFPDQWIELVVVLRCGTRALHDRLTARGYSDAKLQENLDAEIMDILLEEARGAFDEECIVELQSDTAEDVEANVERIEAWIKTWREEQGFEAMENGRTTEGD